MLVSSSTKLKTFNLCATLIMLLASTSTHSVARENNKNILPDFGDAGVSVLSVDKEHQLGDTMMRQLRASQPILHDPILNEYINGLGNQLVKHADGVNYSFEFFLLNNAELNAFAFFGGHVAVHTGLISAADSESELASVLAHEISHVTQRHLARSLADRNKTQPLTTAGLISGVLLSLVNPNLGMAAISTSLAAGQQSVINYTRSNEKEADRIGIKLLASSGFDPNGAPSFFNKMAEKYRYQSKPPAILLTHPLPDSRITDARLRAQNYYVPKVAPKLDFALTKARIQARYEHNAKYNIDFYQSTIKHKRYIFKEAAQYGLALAYFEDKQYPQAEKILQSLHQQAPNNLFYSDALSDCYLAVNKFGQAKALWSKMALNMPNNQVVSLNYAHALEQSGQYEQAAVIIKDFLLLNPEHFLAHSLLKTIYQKQNNTALMYQQKAEVYALLGAYQRAIDELHTGYKAAQAQPLLRKRMQARINQFREKTKPTKKRRSSSSKEKRHISPSHLGITHNH